MLGVMRAQRRGRQLSWVRRYPHHLQTCATNIQSFPSESSRGPCSQASRDAAAPLAVSAPGSLRGEMQMVLDSQSEYCS